MTRPMVYLAGAIRDEHPEDVEWREEILAALPRVLFLNPLGGKTYDPATRLWRVAGRLSNAAVIVKHDAWCVDRADIILANLQPLAEGYPSIGTLLELGRAWHQQKLVYVILPARYRGHENSTMYWLHPFLQQISAMRFETVGDSIRFMRRHVQTLSGENPHYDGVLLDT